jgi:phospholipid-binding lipoprotein MlaA
MTRPISSSPAQRPAFRPAITGGCALAALLATMVIGGAPSARAASADPVVAHTPGDPWERVNRTGYAIQGGLDRHVIRPLSKLYRKLTPGPIGRGIHNVLVNLSEPAALINDVLQLRIKRAGVPAARLLINSTLGVFGLLDAAAGLGLVHHDNEFGVTLGRYGVAPGPYLYVPLVGPSTARDLVGAGVDFVTNPSHWMEYPHQAQLLEARFALNGLDTEVATEAQLNALLSGAVDPYATLRSAFLQSKQAEIEGNGVPLALPTFDEPAPTPAPPPSGGISPEGVAPDGVADGSRPTSQR